MIPVLDLFSGVGAYSLGLERTGGFKTVAFCELDPFARKVLRKHWPDVPIYEDVETLTGARLRADGIVPEWIVAGWPCQDISAAGARIGLDGARSGLFEHIARLARETGAVGLLLENSTNLLALNGGADFGHVLRTLAALGFDVTWHCLPAAAFDAPHIRDRLWIVAMVADASVGVRRVGLRQDGARGRGRRQPHHGGGEVDVPDAELKRRSRSRKLGGVHGSQASQEAATQPLDGRQERGAITNADRLAKIGPAIARQERHTWEPEPDVARVAPRTAFAVDRVRCIGNLNPPIIPQTIGHAILEALS